MSNTLRHLLLAVCLFLSLGLAGAQDPCKIPRNASSSCSYTALNGSCTVTINRLHPISTATIYARRGSRITVIVLNPSPFEDLSLDLKSATAQAPPDQFAKGFTNLTSALAGFEISQPHGLSARALDASGNSVPGVGQIVTKQAALLKDMQKVPDAGFNTSARQAIRAIHKIELPLPVSACEDTTRDALDPWLKTASWRADVLKNLNDALNPLNSAIPGFETRIKEIRGQIDTIILSVNGTEYDVLTKNQKQLTEAESALTLMQSQLSDLQSEAGKIPDQGKQQPLFVTDLQRKDKNYEIQVWSLNYVNKLGAVAKRVSADKYVGPDSVSFAGLADTPNKQTISTVNVQFEPDTRFELSTGFLVPVTPYHSYAAAQSASATAPVVQKTDTYTVVPAAFFNFLLGKELVVSKQRMAFFFTGAVGYTPATSSVALAIGPSFSWRSIVLSPLADFSRDTKLTGGWTVGQSLGTATAPMTTSVWEVKPAIGISVRIPLGGASQ
ncbi:hypothetical protein [Tunturiibacter gelidoferens]|uniref:Uncharacterized protein n=1 Tax=Tunturiibacter gelidiferens TaxID=3069689 RepID=A0ACC5NTI9_9BACT|nr:hypothetical protein [Edaphobacter lichenicola]MBB5337830.1 hypothetical protein [Edaphobacter lichenicola]